MGSTRLTRAKAAALHVDELSQPTKPLQSKKAGTNATVAGTRKRAALGDVSNVTKVEVTEGKKTTTKSGVVSKATANRVTKSTTTAASRGRPPLSSKEPNATTTKKTTKASGAGEIGSKRKAPPATAPAVKGTPEASEPVRKKVHTAEKEKENQRRPKITKEEVVESEPVAEPEPEIEPREAIGGFVYPEGVRHLDDEDHDDPLMVAEYAHEIFEYLLNLEPASLPNPDYMEHQDELEWKTRSILVDWLIEVHTRFHLLPETLFLAINIIDRFLSEKVVQLDRVQLVGITAMFIASKYEEVLSPHVGNFKHVADNGFSEAEILSAERFILQTLEYDLSYPNPMNFLRRISKADNYDIQTRTVAKYLLEISVVDHRFMSYRPSHVAAAAMYLARLILDRGDWVSTVSSPHNLFDC